MHIGGAEWTLVGQVILPGGVGPFRTTPFYSLALQLKFLDRTTNEENYHCNSNIPKVLPVDYTVHRYFRGDIKHRLNLQYRCHTGRSPPH